MGHLDVQALASVLPDGRVLFEDVSFRVGEGAATVLVGADGTGKTTLLRPPPGVPGCGTRSGGRRIPQSW